MMYSGDEKFCSHMLTILTSFLKANVAMLWLPSIASLEIEEVRTHPVSTRMHAKARARTHQSQHDYATLLLFHNQILL